MEPGCNDLFGHGKNRAQGQSEQFKDVAGLGHRRPHAQSQSDAHGRQPDDARLERFLLSGWRPAPRQLRPRLQPIESGAEHRMRRHGQPEFRQSGARRRLRPKFIRGWGRREYNWGVLGRGAARNSSPRVDGGVYFRRWSGKFTVTDDLTVAAADFDRFSIPAPADPRLPDGGGYIIGDLYNINPAKFGQAGEQLRHPGEQLRRADGPLERDGLTVNARPRNGLLLQGGLSTGRAST